MPTSTCHRKRKRKSSVKSSVEESDTKEKEANGTSNEGAAASLKGKESPNERKAFEGGETDNLISTPSLNDVVLGRGKPFQIHPGNVRMRKILSEHQARYLACRRDHRRVYAERLLEVLLESGIRFIKRRVMNKRVFWEPVDRLVALDKVHHFLRENKREKNETEDERGISISCNETQNQSSNVGGDIESNPSNFASLASQPCIGTGCEIVSSSPVEPAARRGRLRRRDETLMIPLETQAPPQNSVSSLTSETYPIDVFFQGGASITGDTTIDLYWRQRLLERSVFTEQASLATAPLYAPCSAASLQSQNRFEAGFSSLLSGTSIPPSPVPPTPSLGIGITGSSSSIQQWLNACLSPNPMARPNMRL